MSFLADFHFIRPAWLLLIPIVVAVWWMERRSGDPLRGWRGLMDPDLLAAMTVGDNAGSRRRGIGILAAWLMAGIAIAGPTWRLEPSPFADDPVPVMLVLRAGETMNQSDLLPTRMERARLKVADFASARLGQPSGLVAYAGSAHLVLPPTRDTDVVTTMSAEIAPEIMPKPGDDLAIALRLAARTFGDTGGSMVIVTDTVAPGNDASLAGFRAESSLPVHFLAIARSGTPELDSIRRAARSMRSSVTVMTADSADINALVRKTAGVSVSTSQEDGVRWAETGWWLTPLLALFSLSTFRRLRDDMPLEADE
jgi:Ca-activated chloride channel family protein